MLSHAQDFVMNLLDKRLSEGFLFHSKKHTLDVLRNSAIIGEHCGFSGDEMNLVRISALFHDVGYISSSDGHESESALIAGEFLRSVQVGEQEIKIVCEAILATKVPQQPKNRISEVLCDADLMHLTGEDYFEQMDLLRLEWQRTGRYTLTEYEFHLNSIEFFNHHHYHSEYGRNTLEPQKAETLKKIRIRADLLKES